MIIACPECTGPFEVADDQIAALVQVECPHCVFRMILDFAAANDASLVETGMRMASGFRSAADYRAVVQGPAARPYLEAVPTTEPSATEAAEAAADQAAQAEAAAAQAAQAEAAAAQAEAAATQAEAAAAQAAATRRPPTEPAARPATQQPTSPAARGDTIVGPFPTPAKGETVIGPAPTAPVVMAAVVPDEPDDEVTQIRTIQERPVPEESRKVPHTPPTASPPTAKREDEGGKRIEITHKPARKRPEEADQDGKEPARTPRPRFDSALPIVEDDEPPARSGVLGTTLVVLLALLAAGLVAASVVQTDTPDPRPLLENLYRQYVK